METAVLKRFSACEPSYDSFIGLANQAKGLADEVYQLQISLLVKTGQAGNFDPALIVRGDKLLKEARENLDKFVAHIQK